MRLITVSIAMVMCFATCRGFVIDAPAATKTQQTAAPSISETTSSSGIGWNCNEDEQYADCASACPASCDVN